MPSQDWTPRAARFASGKGRPPIGASRRLAKGFERVGWSYPRALARLLRQYAITFRFTPPSSNVLWMAYAFDPSRAGFYGGWVTPELVGPLERRARIGNVVAPRRQALVGERYEAPRRS